MGFRSGAKRCTYEATASPAGGRLSAESFPRVRFHRNGCGERALSDRFPWRQGLTSEITFYINANVDF